MKKNKLLLIATVILSLGLTQTSNAAVIGLDDFDTAGTYLTRTFSGTVNSGSSTFDIVNRDTVLTTEIVDTSEFASAVVAVNAADAVGFLESTDTDNFLGIHRAATRTLTYTFDINGYTGLSLSADWVFGENWASTVAVTASIDGGAASEIFSVRRDTVNSNITMELGGSSTQNNTAEIFVNGVETALLTDNWANYVANITGTGSTLTLVISEPSSFAGSIGIDNLVLSGTAIPEPSTFALLVLGVAGLVFRRRRA